MLTHLLSFLSIEEEKQLYCTVGNPEIPGIAMQDLINLFPGIVLTLIVHNEIFFLACILLE